MGIFRKFAERVYSKLNPQYKHIIRTRNAAYESRDALSEIEKRLSVIEELLSGYGPDQEHLASEITVYRYLYLKRYINGGERVLDLEGMYGTGINLLLRYTSIESGTCCNSISYYTEAGKRTYESMANSVEYVSGTIFDIGSKYDIVTAFNERKNEAIDRAYFERIAATLEDGGILAIALSQEKKKQMDKLLSLYGFNRMIELYQDTCTPELTEKPSDDAVTINYYTKTSL